jgi:acyl-CoA synthetase (NDP forming)
MTFGCCRPISMRPRSRKSSGSSRALLKAFRGAPARDVGAVAEMAVKLAAFMRAHPEVAEVDINPVMVYAQGEGAVALDALIVAR